MSTPTADPYGVKSNGKVWERIPHCYFPDWKGITETCLAVPPDFGDDALDLCKRSARSYYSSGFVVAPVKLPDTVWQGFKDDGVHPLPFGHLQKSTHNGSGNIYNVTCDRDELESKGVEWACQSYQGRTPGETFATFETTNDPRDPMFYSTCYVPKGRVHVSEHFATTGQDRSDLAL